MTGRPTVSALLMLAVGCHFLVLGCSANPRMKQPSQTVPEILLTILLDSIKLKYLTIRIAALDFGRGVAVVELPSGDMRTIQFDTRTLAIKT